MLQNLKALIVLLALALPTFALARPICLRFMAASDFERRRMVWLVLTAAAFLLPDFWLFFALALPLVYWAGRRDAHPIALYLLLLHVIPPNISAELPAIGINRLFGITGYRILAFAILIPLAWQLSRMPPAQRGGRLSGLEWLLIAFGVLQLVLFMPYESITNTMRRAFLYWLDTFLLFYAIWRGCRDRGSLVDALACYCLALALAVPVSAFEAAKSWLLYDGISQVWGQVGPISNYLFREATLRAQASFGHALALGYSLAIAFGFWLYLRTRLPSPRVGLAVGAFFWVGLIAAYSRAPWLVAVLTLFAFLAFGPNGRARALRAVAIAVPLAGLALISPLGDRIVDNLPFVGTVDAVNVTYRQQLATKSWELIQENPFFGDAFVLYQLEELRQGQGIIDLVNTYASIAMFYGLVGLALLLAPALIGLFRARRAMRRAVDAEDRLLGACILACMVGTLLMMATGSFGTSLAAMYYVLAAFLAAFGRFALEAGWSNQAHPRMPGSRRPAAPIGRLRGISTP